MKKIIKAIVVVSFLALVCLFFSSIKSGSLSTASSSTSISKICCTDTTPTQDPNFEDIEYI